MIDTDETGQKKLDELMKNINLTDTWTDWEHQFLQRVRGNSYSQLPQKAKGKVGELYRNLTGGEW